MIREDRKRNGQKMRSTRKVNDADDEEDVARLCMKLH